MTAVICLIDESQKVSVSDKAMVRENILGFIVQVPPLLRYLTLSSDVSYFGNCMQRILLF
jgi:ABC-type lipoprotein export system ATPase subunit